MAHVSVVACPLCGGTDGRTVWRENGREGRLDDCGVVCMHPPAPEFDLSQEYHSELYYQMPAATRLAWLQKYVSCGDLLEVGCGFGSFLKQAQSAGFRVAGLEPAANRAAYTRDVLGIPVTEGWVESLETDQRYDVVYHVDLVSHFPDPKLALHSMGKLLKPDGLLVFEVGVLGDMSPLWYRIMGGVGYPHHLRLFSTAALKRLFNDAGFDIVAMRSFTLAPTLLPLLARRLAGSLFKRRVARDLKQLSEPGDHGWLYRFYFRILTWLRYALGRWLPPFGPLTLFVTLKPKDNHASC